MLEKQYKEASTNTLEETIVMEDSIALLNELGLTRNVERSSQSRGPCGIQKRRAMYSL